MENTAPFSSVWGSVTHVRRDPKNKGHVLVTIFGKTLRLARSTDDGLAEMGLLRLTKRNEKVFLIFWVGKYTGMHHVLAGWNNPDSLVVRKLQALIAVESDDFYKIISEYCPVWKGFDTAQDYFAEVNDAAP